MSTAGSALAAVAPYPNSWSVDPVFVQSALESWAVDELKMDTSANTHPRPLMLLEPSYSEGQHHQQLDPLSAISLINQLKELIAKSLSLDGSIESRLELSNQANRLKQSISSVELQIKDLTAGDLSIVDQEELISKLEKRINIERELLDFMSDALPKKMTISNANESTSPNDLQPPSPDRTKVKEEVVMEI